MAKKNYLKYNKYRENRDLYEINELEEMGFDKEELAKELSISKKYVKKIIDEYYDNY